MPLNPSGRQQIPWSGQYGLNTEVEPADLPEGLSPDNQDQSFVPGKSGTRPAVEGVLGNTLGEGLAVTYLKSFVQPNGDPLNLELTADGVMHMQDVNNSPNVNTSPFSVTPGVYSSSVTAFNREYFAFHNGSVAQDIPRSFDGISWYRLTQDACATNAMTAADAATTTVPIVMIVPVPESTILTATLGDGFITIVTSTPHNLAVGDNFLITGNSVFQYNGPGTVATVPNPTTFTYDSAASALNQGTGGNVIPDTVTVTTTIPHGLISGETITIAGNSDNNYNNSQGASSENVVGVVGGAVSQFYANPSGYIDGAFCWTYGNDGANKPLPSSPISTTFNWASNQALMWNPNTDYGGNNLLDFGVENNGEENGNGMWIPGVTTGVVPPPTVGNNMSYVQSGTTAKLYILDASVFTSGNPVLSAAFTFGPLQVTFSNFQGSNGPNFLQGQTVTVTNIGQEHLSNHDDEYWFIEFTQPTGSYSYVGNPAPWAIEYQLVPAVGFVPPANSWDGTLQLWNGFGYGDGGITASLKKLYDAVTYGNLSFSAAGNYTFKVVHKEGAMIGMGGGVTYVSGPQSDITPAHTKSALKGYPLVYINNVVNGNDNLIFNAQFTVSVPAAGTYPFEIDWDQWSHSRPTFSIQYENTESAFVPLVVGSGSNTFATPATWTVGDVLGPETFKFDAVYAVGTGFGGTITVGGLIDPGAHQVVCYFETETDSFTAPCPPITWNSAGNKRVQITNIPIGPPNVTARWLAFTGAAGSNFFSIPVPARDPQTGQQVSTSTVINDNTTTSATFDFSDNTLFDSDAIDITGNNLFAQVTLGPCANITQYSNRLAVWGDTNKIQNLLSMGFEGGIPSPGSTMPLWWDTSGDLGAGQLVAGEFGYAWQITGNGTDTPLGMITQPAFQDYLFLPILTPSTQYTFQCIAYSAFGSSQGSIVAEFYSPTGGSIAAAAILVSSLGVGLENAEFVSATFNTPTPAVIPADTVLRYYTVGTVNGQQVTIDETSIIYTAQPIVPGQMRFSYAFNPEAFDGVTGVRAIEYSEPVLEAKILRDNLYIVSQGHLSRTQDNGIGEPATWTNYTVSDKAGGLSLRSFDLGEGWGVFASQAGLYMFSGGEPVKISQEIQTLWSSIDPTLYQHVWIKNDLTNRRIYIGAPITLYPPTGRTFTPQSVNKLLVVDYRELNSSGMIENAPPLHISMTGKMLSSDLTRKWTVWNLPMNCAEVMYLPDAEQQICFGSGLGNGLIGIDDDNPDDEAESYGFGQFYTLNDEMYADQDYGIIGSFNGESPLEYKQWLISGPKTPQNPMGTRPPLPATWRPQRSYYMSYLAPSHEQEQGLQIGSQRKLYEYLEVYATGVGTFSVLPFINTIQNSTNRPASPRNFDLNQVWDLEWPLNMKAQRLALLFYATPAGLIPPVGTITISPTTAYISTFSDATFTYLLLGTPTLDVTWSTSGGSIDQSGNYVAPGTAGTYTVTVTSVDDPTVSATAVVTVHGGYD
jgi:hypothetical protein